MAHHWVAQRASYLAQHSYLFGTNGTVNYDYIVTNSINYLLIGSRCIANGTHDNHWWTNLAHASKRIKNFDMYEYVISKLIDYSNKIMMMIHEQCNKINNFHIILHKYSCLSYALELCSTYVGFTCTCILDGL